ncbi:MAG: SRPBCC domain-containing protein [Roseibium sp.]|uniref:SRPBCC family protein n=1 Tax=Roseibium sp. TaxID=1936156 RepID=UPI00261F3221|nr:SRPBCC domain-containing protein [Roseibium sp.]MCV0427506.1 SRPBCC domain-containing protein [Roseibium sp.]
MTETTITKTVILNAPRNVVWDFLTKSEKLARWFHPSENDLEEGAEYALLDQRADMARVCWGTVLEMRPHESLVYTFTVKPLNGAMTTVRWSLKEVAGGTQLTLVHEGIEKAAGEAAFMMLSALDKGWDDHLGRLRQFATDAVSA